MSTTQLCVGESVNPVGSLFKRTPDNSEVFHGICCSVVALSCVVICLTNDWRSRNPGRVANRVDISGSAIDERAPANKRARFIWAFPPAGLPRAIARIRGLRSTRCGCRVRIALSEVWLGDGLAITRQELMSSSTR
jgi:hypothetical protein